MNSGWNGSGALPNFGSAVIALPEIRNFNCGAPHAPIFVPAPRIMKDLWWSSDGSGENTSIIISKRFNRASGFILRAHYSAFSKVMNVISGAPFALSPLAAPRILTDLYFHDINQLLRFREAIFVFRWEHCSDI